MQNKTLRLWQALLAVSMSTIICGAAAEKSLSSFEQALEATGWSVLREADGSLVLEPKTSPSTTPGNNVSTADDWPRLQNELETAGWFVEREADGSLSLIPPGKPVTTEQNNSAEATATSSSGPTPAMQQQLRAAGWRVTRSSDGSILLYPPGNTTTNKPKPYAGTPPSVDVPLPVDSWHSAYRIARSWLKSHPPYHAVVGKIRKVLNVHVVSIVSDQAPYPLIQQIAIRNSDGAVIVLN